MGSLQEILNKFNKQQEKCQLDACSITSLKTNSTKTTTAASKAPVLVNKFSEETKKWQLINNIRKSPVGAQMKRVIDLLYESRKSFTAEQINEASHVDVNGNKALFESLRKNPKVNYDGNHFSYKPTHNVNDKNGLVCLIKEKCVEGVEGIVVDDLKDAYPNVMKDLQAIKDENKIWLLSNLESREVIAYPNNCEVAIKVDDELKKVFRGIELPKDMEEIVKELDKNKIRRMTNLERRREMARKGNVSNARIEKKKKKERGGATKGSSLLMLILTISLIFLTANRIFLITW